MFSSKQENKRKGKKAGRNIQKSDYAKSQSEKITRGKNKMK